MPITARLRETVFLRDARAIYLNDPHRDNRVPFEVWLRRRQSQLTGALCLVELLDPPASRKCSGRSTLEHVKDQLRMGKKAPDDEQHLVILCEYHNVWNPPSKDLRAKIRRYLANAYAATSEQGGGGDQSGVDEER